MILDQIAERTKERIEEKKRRIPLVDYRRTAEALAKEALAKEAFAKDTFAKDGAGGAFARALRKDGMSFICEVKKASPSKGLIALDFPYLKIAGEYEAAGADAVSVLTEPYFFQGSDAYLTEIRRAVSLPVLRKDFTVDEYMIYEAKAIGADAVLLICAILSPGQLSEYLRLAAALGLDALVEAHDEQEIETALAAGAGIIGVNNRNLKDFTVDITNSLRLRKLVPGSVLFVSESGMKTREDIVRLEENGTDAVLIGETFMRSADKRGMLAYLSGKDKETSVNLSGKKKETPGERIRNHED